MLKVAVVGASGYTGVELLRLLHSHPEVAVTCITSEQSAGKPVADVFPTLRKRYGQILENLEPVRVADKADFIFTALPHKAAMEVVPTFLRLGKRIVDLSADYRFHDAAVYEEWYEPHMNPELLSEAVYGLPEVRRDRIVGARLVGNPGCYPTSVILALQPLLRNGLIDPATIIADSKSGVSGAGRGAKVDNLYCEVNEGFKAYGVGGVHRHTPEIEQELSLLAGAKVTISFTPHLVPMDRGILSTVYARLTTAKSGAELAALFADYYGGEQFVRMLPSGSYPSTAHVRGANFCDLGVAVDGRTGRVIVVSAIDNLVKGAAGQAVQNMNIMCGFPEGLGLEGLPFFP
ncbi:N-acetyl-gamma-glutamyl-phosphate reductase [Geobacter sp.]|uniref:N-acetyl-gamma-glutamyl-phosphate reductase n=1 Tax=Geobacter sp. TaxID=46610 RepID=UPI0026361325|nr:N-acetyl-gamma-glutamyl-phosphate reductase [Geobacter sp.]